MRLPLGIRPFLGREGDETPTWAVLFELLKKKITKIYLPEMGWGWFNSSSKLVFVTQLLGLKAIYLDDRHLGVN